MSPLDTFPEELLESILSHVIFSKSPISRIRSPLRLVSKQFHRISTPLYFNTIHLRTQVQLQRLLVFALRSNPSLASHIRKVIIEGTWTEAAVLFLLCSQFGALRILDITLDPDASPPPKEFVKSFFSQMGVATDNLHVNMKMKGSSSSDAEDFCKHLHGLTSVTHLTVRKPKDVFLTQPKTRFVLSQLAKAIKAWKDLEYVNLAFSDDSASIPVPPQGLSFPPPPPPPTPTNTAAITHLIHVLSTLRSLRTFATRLPKLWDEKILRVSRNPVLERIVIEDPLGQQGNNGNAYDYDCYGRQWTTGHFFKEAMKHPRLYELIQAGVGYRVPYSSTTQAHTPSPRPPTSSSQTYSFSFKDLVAQSLPYPNRHHRHRPRPSSMNQSSSTPSQHHFSSSSYSSQSRPVPSHSLGSGIKTTIPSSSSRAKAVPRPSISPQESPPFKSFEAQDITIEHATYTLNRRKPPQRRRTTRKDSKRGDEYSLDSLLLVPIILVLGVFILFEAVGGID